MSKYDQSSLRNQITDIIEHFVKAEIIADAKSDKKFWSRESFMARSLIKRYGYNKLIFAEPGFKVNSLLYFRSFEGIKVLNKLTCTVVMV